MLRLRLARGLDGGAGPLAGVCRGTSEHREGNKQQKHDTPHEHSEDVRIIAADEALFSEMLEVLLGIRVQ